MIDVPFKFRTPDTSWYPIDNHVDFEAWFFMSYKPEQNQSGRIYLPVYWTSFYKHAHYGRDYAKMYDLQLFINSLDKSKKYFTIVQYDDGILHDISSLDIQIFTMSKKQGNHVELPLVAQPHSFAFPPMKRDILFSFAGTDTHPIRNIIFNELSLRKDFYITPHHVPLHRYCEILWRSVFCLCPRGYGPTSFRIQEALQYGAIPIYITDLEYIYPGNFILLQLGHGYSSLYEMLMSIKDQVCVEALQEQIPSIYKNNYTYPAVQKRIYDNLR